jgi:phospholipid transport system substrate-binding protein
MMHRYILLAGVVVYTIFFSAAALVSTVRAEATPKDFVLELLDKVQGMKKAEPEDGVFLTPADTAQNNTLAEHINRMLDVEYISAYSLLGYWEKLDAPDRNRFLATFSELLSKVAYPNAGKFLKDLQVKVRKEKQVKEKAMVFTSVIHREEGRIDIDFKLLQKGPSWVVMDVYLDEVSLARNLRTQCLKIIRDHSFDELLSRMRKKIEERDTANLKEVTGRK